LFDNSLKEIVFITGYNQTGNKHIGSVLSIIRSMSFCLLTIHGGERASKLVRKGFINK